MWDTATGSCRAMLKGHSQSVRAVTFSPDGKLVLSGSSDSTIWLWDTATWSRRITLKGHLAWVSAVAFSSDGQLVASGSDKSSVWLWDAATRSCRATLEGHWQGLSALAFSSDGCYLIPGTDQISLSSSLLNTSSYQKKEPSPTIFVDGQWVRSAEQRLLRHPAEYRSACSAAWKKYILLGHAFGHITILKFDPENISRVEDFPFLIA